jgi:peptidoglycan/LPS O-acetylase OafA/YrhL
MPLAVYFLPRRKLVPLLCAAVLGAPIARVAISYFVPQHHAAQYVLTLCRADALSMGVLLAIGYRKEEWKTRFLRHKRLFFIVGAVPLLAAIFMTYRDPSPYTRAAAIWGLSCIDISCALLLIVAIMFPGGLWASICRWPFLVEMGRLSYCLYVIHEVVNLLCHEALLGTSPRFMDWTSAGVTILAALIAFGLARLSWIYFEEPLLKRGHAYRYFPSHAIPSSAPVAPWISITKAKS